MALSELITKKMLNKIHMIIHVQVYTCLHVQIIQLKGEQLGCLTPRKRVGDSFLLSVAKATRRCHAHIQPTGLKLRGEERKITFTSTVLVQT